MALNSDRHVQEEELERYSLRESAEAECARLEEHLLVCTACRRRLEEHDIYVSSMGTAAAEWRANHQVVERRRWFFLRLVPVMAVLICLAAGAAVWLDRSGFPRTSPAFAVALRTTRGMPRGAQAPAGRALNLQLDFTGLAASPHYDLRVVDRTGAQVAQTETAPGAGACIHALRTGAYFVRIYSPGGELLREYALAVTD